MRPLLAAAVLALASGVATAHPLGNFTTNRLAVVELAPDRLALRYVVDLAELPAYRTLADIDAGGDGRADAAELSAWARGLGGDVARDVSVRLDGAAVRLRAVAQDARVVPGAGGLPTLRAELAYDAPLPAARGTLVVRDAGFASLPGWQEIVVVAVPGVALSATTASRADRTDGLRAYPADALAVPPRMAEARATFAPSAGPALAATSPAGAVRSGATRFGDRLTALVADPTPLSTGTVLGALLAAVLLGALHALTPGHGKTIVGAYLVGARGTWRHAVFLGLVVTATHTAGVYALGAATLVATAWVLPERILPWLSVASGLLVVGVGASLVRERLHVALHHHGPHAHHHHDGHEHAPPADRAPTLRNLLALGVSGGLAPCPSALVVMLGAVAIGRTAFGLALIVAFSVGLAAVLTAIGLVLVHARHLFERLPVDGRVARLAPVASAAIVSLAGLAIVVEALLRMGA